MNSMLGIIIIALLTTICPVHFYSMIIITSIGISITSFIIVVVVINIRGIIIIIMMVFFPIIIIGDVYYDYHPFSLSLLSSLLLLALY